MNRHRGAQRDWHGRASEPKQTVFHAQAENGSCVDFGKVDSGPAKLQGVIKRHAVLCPHLCLALFYFFILEQGVLPVVRWDALKDNY